MADQPFKKMSLIERCALTFESFLEAQTLRLDR